MNRRVFSFALSGACILPMATIASVSNAQDVEPGSRVIALEEVVVTARKREEFVQSTPISMTVMSGEQIEAAGISSVTELDQISPNLSFTTSSDGGSSNVQAYVRGVGQFDFAVTTDPGVGIYIDGVYQARTVGSNMQFSDIQLVSVLRGPQGTLFGKNTIGGAIDIKTKVPTGGVSYSLEAKVGSDDFQGVNAYVEFPLVEDVLAASFSVLTKRSDGWQERPGPDAGNDNMWGGRSHLYWTPTDEFSSHLVVDGVWQEQNVYPRVLEVFDSSQQLPAAYNTFLGTCCTPNSDIDKSNVPGNEDKDDLKAHGLSWTNEWDGYAFSVKAITGFRHTNSDTHRQSDNSPEEYQWQRSSIDHEQFSQEFIFAGDGFDGRLDWVLGLYYFEEESRQVTDLAVAPGLYDVLAALPLPPGVAERSDLTYFYDRNQDTQSTAAYLHTVWGITDDVKLTLAGRVTYEEKELGIESLKRDSQTPILVPGPTSPSACSDVTPWGNGSEYRCDEDWTAFSPQIGIDWQVTETSMTYLQVSRGFRSGIFNGRPTATSQISVADPEYLTNYEWGFKSDLWDRRLRLNGAIFYNEYKDQQVLVNRASALDASGLALIVDNAGRSNTTGAELEFTVLPMEGFTINGALGYIDPEYDEFESVVLDPVTMEQVVEDNSDRPFTNTPQLTGYIGFQYEFDLDAAGSLAVRTDLSYKDDTYYTNDRDSIGFDTLHEKGYTTVDAGIIYTTRDSHWQVALRGHNLTDERRINGGFGVDAFGIVDATYTEPRRYFLSVTYRGGD